MGGISFDKEKLDKLKGDYAMALVEGKKRFQFGRHKLEIRYAKYLIEYLENELEDGKLQDYD